MKGGVVPPGIEPGTHGFSVRRKKQSAKLLADYFCFSLKKSAVSCVFGILQHVFLLDFHTLHIVTAAVRSNDNHSSVL